MYFYCVAIQQKKDILKCHCGLYGYSIRATIPPEPPPSPQIVHKLKKKSLRTRPTECDSRPRDYNPTFVFSKLYRIKEPTCTCLLTKSTDTRNCIYFVLAPRISKYCLNKLKKGKKEKRKRRNQTLVRNTEEYLSLQIYFWDIFHLENGMKKVYCFQVLEA